MVDVVLAIRKQRSFLLVLIILKHVSIVDFDDEQHWIKYCNDDYEFCPMCFKNDFNRFDTENHLIIESTFGNMESSINSLFGSRTMQVATWKNENNSFPVVLKYLSDHDKQWNIKHAFCEYARHFITNNETNCDIIWMFYTMNGSNEEFVTTALKSLFESNQWTDGITSCPNRNNEIQFKDTFNQYSNDLTFWMQLLINPELVILQTAQKNDVFKKIVPRLFYSCGFVMVEQYAGVALYQFYDHSIFDRIYLAEQLLEAASSFSYGINGFRIYWTDATPDNIVVDKSSLEISFADLDNLHIVDSRKATHSDKIHRYERIPCDRCFAYVPVELCSHHLSDINLFTVCQIFTEDNFEGTSKGLLHSMHMISDDKISDAVIDLLHECVNCDKKQSCRSRFDVVNRLRVIFREIRDKKN